MGLAVIFSGLFWISGGLFSMMGYHAKGTIRNDCRPLQNPAGSLGGPVRPPVGPWQIPGGGPGGKAPGSSKHPKVYITKKRPETDSQAAFLTQDMPMITYPSPEFWCCWFILEVDEGPAIPVG